MRVHRTGMVIVAVILLLTLVAGTVPTIAVLRVGVVLYVIGAFLEVVANMVRYRDMHVRSRLLGLLFDSTFSPWQGSFAPWVRSKKR